MEVLDFPASLGAAVPGGGILLAHALAERKEKLYKKTLPQQELGFLVVIFSPLRSFLCACGVSTKGKKKKKKKTEKEEEKKRR